MTAPSREDLLEHFREEAEEHVSSIGRALLTLEVSRELSGVEEILRRAHSLKGAAKLVGAVTIERLTHALETILAEIQARRIDVGAEVVDTLLEAVDALRASLSELDGGAHTDGAEDVISRVLSLAAAAPGLDDALDARAPGLDPEIRDVMTEFQKSELLLAIGGGKSCWEAELSASEEEFAERIDRAQAALKGAGDVISLAGLASPPGGKLRFKFLVATRLSTAAFERAAKKASVQLSAPTTPRVVLPPQLVVTTAEEDAFSAEMARLVVMYVTETADEVDEAAKQVLALEASPDDASLVHTLFRTAHSLKGSGMTYGLPAVSRVAHGMETVLDAIRNRHTRATARITTALLQAVDTLKELFVEARDGRLAEDRPLPVLAALEAAASGDAGPPAPAQRRMSASVRVQHDGDDPSASAAVRTQAARRAGRTSAGAESIRVRLGTLDRLVNLAGEMTIARNTREAAVKEVDAQTDTAKAVLRQFNALRDRLRTTAANGGVANDQGIVEQQEWIGRQLTALGDGLDDLRNRFTSSTAQSGATTDALQESIMRIRMVPVAALFDAAPRVIRDLTADKVKDVRLVVSGESTELDKRVLEMMTDPLMHLLRNAVDHGIEPVAERRAAGKPPHGTLQLSAEHRGSHIVITIRDDGRGMDPARLAQAAVAKGLLAERDAERLTPEQAYALVFHPGFSTKSEVTAISGRGVGMDVVKSNVDALKGRIEIESETGRGTMFRTYLPLTVSIIQVVRVECGGQTFCLPTTSVAEIIGVADNAIDSQDGKACFDLRGRTIPVARLSTVLGLERATHESVFPMAVIHGQAGMIGLVLEHAVEEQTVVVKELGRLLARAPHVAGAAVLADGRIALILDVASIAQAAMVHEAGWRVSQPKAAPAARRKSLLVVDDSLTTRGLMRGLLETAGYSVVVAVNGLDAWSKLRSGNRFDVVITDVSMPEMDGYELTSRIKADPKLMATPVIMVTSLSSPEERIKGMQAGADAYVTKGAFDQAGLLGRIQELVGTP